MEDWPGDVFISSESHMNGVVVYENDHFNIWTDAKTFSQSSVRIFGQDFTNLLTQSTGCLLLKKHGIFDHHASAFVVKHFPSPSKVTHKGSPVKALLLTAAIIFNDPFSFDITPLDLYFTLSPTLQKPHLDDYSKFKVTRLCEFEPFEGEEQLDPLLNYPYMLPKDVDLLVIFEDDPDHIQGNVINMDIFTELEFEAWTERVDRTCVVVGYPAVLSFGELAIEEWAPITAKQQQLKQQAKTLAVSNEIARSFSVGSIIKTNDTCMAISSSTGRGMAGSPICIRSKDGQRLVFCGVYNGSAALPFQALTSKIMFRLQGKNIDISMNDIPRLPNKNSVSEQYGWVMLLRRFLSMMIKSYQDYQHFIDHQRVSIGCFLFDAMYTGADIQHNLGVCGGRRVDRLIQGSNAIEPHQQTLNFNLNLWQSNPNFANNDLENNAWQFYATGIQRKSTNFGIFKIDAYYLAMEHVTYLGAVIFKIRTANPAYTAQRLFSKFTRKILPKFRKILQLWVMGLPNIPTVNQSVIM